MHEFLTSSLAPTNPLLSGPARPWPSSPRWCRRPWMPSAPAAQRAAATAPPLLMPLHPPPSRPPAPAPAPLPLPRAAVRRATRLRRLPLASLLLRTRRQLLRLAAPSRALGTLWPLLWHRMCLLPTSRRLWRPALQLGRTARQRPLSPVCLLCPLWLLRPARQRRQLPRQLATPARLLRMRAARVARAAPWCCLPRQRRR